MGRARDPLKVVLDDPRSLPESAWLNGHAALKRYLSSFAENGSRAFVGNLETTVMGLAAGRLTLPVTVNQADYGNCYVCSPHTAYSLYAREETRLVPNPLLRWSLRAATKGAGRLLKAARFDRVVHINNWMLSTNLYPEMDGSLVSEITQVTVSQYPGHFICWRSLNRTTAAPLMDELVRRGYTLLPSRQVYIFDPLGRKWRRTYDARNDRSLLRRSTYRVEDPIKLQGSDYERVALLYGKLYLEKYSPLNPAFTARYIRLCQESGAMRFIGLRSPEGIIDGIIGQFTVERVTTTPIFGYDTALPRDLGLYRMLTTLLLEGSIARGLTVNASSGAASFKRMRGGEPAIEYTAVYSRYLPLGRRLGIEAFASGIRKAVVPMMRTLRL
jgi:hypothetical protein